MAIRRPEFSSTQWVFQDFLYEAIPGSEQRYLQVKWDGDVFPRKSQTFDYSNPPYTNAEQRGGPIIAQIDYTVEVGGKIVVITNWASYWKDEYPLRLALNYLKNCLYRKTRGYVIKVANQEVYNQAGEPIANPNKEPLPFWISEEFEPLSNLENDYLYR